MKRSRIFTGLAAGLLSIGLVLAGCEGPTGADGAPGGGGGGLTAAGPIATTLAGVKAYFDEGNPVVYLLGTGTIGGSAAGDVATLAIGEKQTLVVTSYTDLNARSVTAGSVGGITLDGGTLSVSATGGKLRFREGSAFTYTSGTITGATGTGSIVIDDVGAAIALLGNDAFVTAAGAALIGIGANPPVAANTTKVVSAAPESGTSTEISTALGSKAVVFYTNAEALTVTNIGESAIVSGKTLVTTGADVNVTGAGETLNVKGVLNVAGKIVVGDGATPANQIVLNKPVLSASGGTAEVVLTRNTPSLALTANSDFATTDYITVGGDSAIGAGLVFKAGKLSASASGDIITLTGGAAAASAIATTGEDGFTTTGDLVWSDKATTLKAGTYAAGGATSVTGGVIDITTSLAISGAGAKIITADATSLTPTEAGFISAGEVEVTGNYAIANTALVPGAATTFTFAGGLTTGTGAIGASSKTLAFGTGATLAAGTVVSVAAGATTIKLGGDLVLSGTTGTATLADATLDTNGHTVSVEGKITLSGTLVDGGDAGTSITGAGVLGITTSLAGSGAGSGKKALISALSATEVPLTTGVAGNLGNYVEVSYTNAEAAPIPLASADITGINAGAKITFGAGGAKIGTGTGGTFTLAADTTIVAGSKDFVIPAGSVIIDDTLYLNGNAAVDGAGTVVLTSASIVTGVPAASGYVEGSVGTLQLGTGEIWVKVSGAKISGGNAGDTATLTGTTLGPEITLAYTDDSAQAITLADGGTIATKGAGKVVVGTKTELKGGTFTFTGAADTSGHELVIALNANAVKSTFTASDKADVLSLSAAALIDVLDTGTPVFVTGVLDLSATTGGGGVSLTNGATFTAPAAAATNGHIKIDASGSTNQVDQSVSGGGGTADTTGQLQLDGGDFTVKTSGTAVIDKSLVVASTKTVA